MQFCPPSGAADCFENRCGTIARCKGSHAKRKARERRRGRGRGSGSRKGRDCNRNRSLALICHFARMATTALESTKGGERGGKAVLGEWAHNIKWQPHTDTHTHAYSRKNFCFSLRRVKSCSFFYKNFSVFFFGFFFTGFYGFFLFLCLTPAAFLASISVAATHRHTQLDFEKCRKN